MTHVRLICLIGVLIPPGLTIFDPEALPVRAVGLAGSALASLLFFLVSLLCVAEGQQNTVGVAKRGGVRVGEFLWLSLATWVALRSDSLPKLASALQILGLGGVLLAMRGYVVRRSQLITVLRVGALWGAVLAGLSVVWVDGRAGDNTSGSMIGIFAYYPLALMVLTKSRFERGLAGLSVCGMGASLFVFRSRSSLVALGVALALAVFFLAGRPRFKKRAVALLAVLVLTVTPVLYMVFGNPHLVEDALHGIRVQEDVRLGKRLRSGRDRIWPRVAKVVREHPWIGSGTRPDVFRAIGFRVSAHNSFLQAWWEWGLVGLAALGAVCAATLIQLASRGSPLAGLSAAFFAGFLCRESFEVSLIEGNSALALASWTVVGVGLLRVAGEDSKSRSPTLEGAPG
jgi:O-antigen ligase